MFEGQISFVLATLSAAAALFLVLELEVEARRRIARRVAGIAPSLLARVRLLNQDDKASLDSLLALSASPREILEYLKHQRRIAARLDDVERIWGGEHVEDECTKQLCQNPWMLSPDLRPTEHIFFKRHLKTIAQEYFPGDRYGEEWKFLQESKEADAVGVFYRMTGADSASEGEPVLVVIESKNPKRTVNQFVMDEALQYGVNLRKLSRTLAHWNIECIALGATVQEGITTQLYRFGSTPNTLTVTPMTWAGILLRSRQLDASSIQLDKTRINDSPPNHLTTKAFARSANQSASAKIEELSDHEALRQLAINA